MANQSGSERIRINAKNARIRAEMKTPAFQRWLKREKQKLGLAPF